MRAINKIIIHCSATPEGRNDTVDDIWDWHVNGNGWSDIGYHYVIHLDGSVHEGRQEETRGAHTSGQNHDSIGICYVGGMNADMTAPKDTRTPEQKAALRELVHELLSRYPEASVHGHREYANKACPSFDVQAEAWDEGEGNRMDNTEAPDDPLERALHHAGEVGRALVELKRKASGSRPSK